MSDRAKWVVRRGLTIHTGPMASGKSEALVGMLDWRPRGQCVAFRPSKDTRGEVAGEGEDSAGLAGYGRGRLTQIRSRAGVTFPAYRIERAADALALAGAAEVVAFDEAHLFPDGFEDTVRALMAMRKWVHVAGLDLDWRGVPFEPMPALMALADEVNKYRAHCGECLGKGIAVHTARRFVPAGVERIAVGDLDEYVPLCRECWTTWPHPR